MNTVAACYIDQRAARKRLFQANRKPAREKARGAFTVFVSGHVQKCNKVACHAAFACIYRVVDKSGRVRSVIRACLCGVYAAAAHGWRAIDFRLRHVGVLADATATPARPRWLSVRLLRWCETVVVIKPMWNRLLR